MNSRLGPGLKKLYCGGDEGLKVFESIGDGNEDQNGEGDCVEILLMFDAAVDGERGIEGVDGSAAQEFSVRYSGPAHDLCGENVELGWKENGEAAGKRLVKQQLHRVSL